MLLVAMLVIGCGKKGPPLPPLVKIPAAPADFTAERRGENVDLQLIVPAANTDNTRPANIGRIDVYAITSREPIAEAQIVKQGTRVASLTVKAPKDPDNTIEEDEPPADMEAPEGRGLDQGATARASEELTATALVPAELKDARSKPKPPESNESAPLPLLGPRPLPIRRFYVAVGVTPKDRKGAFSKTLAVPLVPPPPPPDSPTVDYDEQSIAVRWTPIAPGPGIQRPESDDELPSRAIGVDRPAISYNVYDVSAEEHPARLTRTPVTSAEFSDSRMAWGEERCYTVRSVEKIGDLTIESDAPPAACKMLEDTFPPAVPANLQSSPGEGTISLIWDANTEKDLAGYIVLRGTSADALQPLMTAPIADTSFTDRVQSGLRLTYAVRAVDKAGNASAASKPVEEAAR